MKQHIFQVKVYEVERGTDKPKPLTLEADDRRISATSIDNARRAAKQMIETKLCRVVRSLSAGPRDITIYVYPASHKKKPMTMKASRV